MLLYVSYDDELYLVINAFHHQGVGKEEKRGFVEFSIVEVVFF